MWIARNKDGSLWICNTKPIRTSDKGNKGYWEYDDFDGILEIKDKSLFSDLTWEDEPVEVCLCLNTEKFHTVKVEELDRLYRMDWNYSDMKETLETFEDRIQRYNSLPWYKRIFKKV